MTDVEEQLETDRIKNFQNRNQFFKSLDRAVSSWIRTLKLCSVFFLLSERFGKPV